MVSGTTPAVKLGGMFCTSDEGFPIFVPQDKNGVCDRSEASAVVTDNTRGLKVRIDSHPTCLYPNEYLIIGEVSDDIEISSLVPSIIEDRIDVYEGEFTLVREGNVTFPSTIKWSWNSETSYSRGATYQFRIVNGLGYMNAFGAQPIIA